MIRKKAGGADEPASLFAVMYHEERKENRMITLPQRFKERMKELLGEEYSAVMSRKRYRDCVLTV